MSNVTSIHGWPVPSQVGEPNHELVEMMNELMERVNSGAVVGAVIALQFCDSTISWRISGAVSRAQIIGAIEGAKWEVVKDLVEND